MLAGAVFVGCGGREPVPSGPEPVAAAPTPSATPAVDAAPAPVAESIGLPDAAPPPMPPPPPPPPPVERAGKKWPFHEWDRAEAIAFNQFEMRSRTPLYAYNARGFSPHIASRKWLSDELAAAAVKLIGRTKGEVGVSKCPFPRHAVVLYSGDVPVASINVCFQCGDILVWPHFAPEPEWDTMTPRQMKKWQRANAKKMKLYKKAFPQWEQFFRDDVGYPIRASYR